MSIELFSFECLSNWNMARQRQSMLVCILQLFCSIRTSCLCLPLSFLFLMFFLSGGGEREIERDEKIEREINRDVK